MGQRPNLHWFLTQKWFSPRNNAVKIWSSSQLVQNGLVKPANITEMQIGHEKLTSRTPYRGNCTAWRCASPMYVVVFPGQRGIPPEYGRPGTSGDTPSDVSLTSSHPCRSLRGSNHQNQWTKGQEMGCHPCMGSQHRREGARM